jgi:LPXTG-site transpeptidase (sortase) family protein
VVTLALGVGSTNAVVGYTSQTNIQVQLSGPSGTVRCDRTATISAKIVGLKNGKPVPNQIVNWSQTQSQSSADGLTARSTVTDSKGRTSVDLVFGPVVGPRTVEALASNAGANITVRCAGGLPLTAPVPVHGFPSAPSGALLAPPAAVEAPPTDLPATGLRLDRLGIDVPLVEGDGVTVPDGAAAHYPGTAWPGEGSNTYLYAHARAGHFLELWQVRTGDLLELDLADGGEAAYRVTHIEPLAEWDALQYLAPTRTERLTLQTCLTYDDTAPRFIVIAEPVSGA